VFVDNDEQPLLALHASCMFYYVLLCSTMSLVCARQLHSLIMHGTRWCPALIAFRATSTCMLASIFRVWWPWQSLNHW